MTREKFIEILDIEGYSYEMEGDKIVVTRGDIYGDVWLNSLKTLPPGVEFKNGGNVWLDSLEILPPGVVFNNGGDVFLKSIMGTYFSKWDGNIDGISPNRLLNKMIADGLFDRR